MDFKRARGWRRIGRSSSLFGVIVALLAMAAPAHGAFPGANGKIVFTGRASTDRFSDIYSVNPDGSGLTNLTNSAAVDERDPAWSPDGERIVFTRRSPAGDSEIWVMNADGSGQHSLGTLGIWPAWSSDGTRSRVRRPVRGVGRDRVQRAVGDWRRRQRSAQDRAGGVRTRLGPPTVGRSPPRSSTASTS